MNKFSQLSRNRIKSIGLLRKRTDRYKQKQFIAEGLRTVEQIIDNGILDIVAIIVDEQQLKDGIPDSWYEKVRDIPFFTVTTSTFRQLSDTESSQGAMAVCHMPDPVTEAELLARNGVIFVADRLQDPGNLGTIIRTAAWFGLCGLVFAPGTVDLFHPKVVRSTAGATGVLPWMETDLAVFFEKAQRLDWRIHVLDSGSNTKSFRELRPCGKDLLVAGNEAQGVSLELKGYADTLLRIDPVQSSGQMKGNTEVPVESLNVSVASAIVMAHFCR
ncbi:MAG: RNA methyltransferase [Balneolales bacterium]